MTEPQNELARFPTRLEAVWFAAHVAQWEPTIAQVAREWVVSVPQSAAADARRLLDASRATS